MNRMALLLLIALIWSFQPVLAEGDLWDHFGDNNTYGQKAVTDKEFEEALDSKTAKPKKQKDRLLRNGESFQQSNETEFLSSIPKELPILLIPVDLVLEEDKVLPIGHYQIMGERKGGKVYMKFYQAHELLAQLEVTETNDDFGEEEINFVRMLENDDKSVKIIFGSIDFNAYTTLSILQKKSEY